MLSSWGEAGWPPLPALALLCVEAGHQGEEMDFLMVWRRGTSVSLSASCGCWLGDIKVGPVGAAWVTTGWGSLPHIA